MKAKKIYFGLILSASMIISLNAFATIKKLSRVQTFSGDLSDLGPNVDREERAIVSDLVEQCRTLGGFGDENALYNNVISFRTNVHHDIVTRHGEVTVNIYLPCELPNKCQ